MIGSDCLMEHCNSCLAFLIILHNHFCKNAMAQKTEYDITFTVHR